jgi:glucose-6-phosphate 1-epimerase
MTDPMQIAKLNERFGIEKLVRIDAGRGGLPRVVIHTPVAQAEIYLHGAHVTHYQPHGQQPVLFVSSGAIFEAGNHIRGGVPICFPWFGQREGQPDAPMHGFVRSRSWELIAVEQKGQEIHARLRFVSDDDTRAQWPHDFEAVYEVAVGATLSMELAITNRSDDAFTFEEALHSYLTVSDVRQVAITGLAGATYIDKEDNFREKTLGDEPIYYTGAFDRVVVNSTATCELHDPGLERTIRVAKQNSNTTVLWNPGEKGKPFADLPDAERIKFVCIETANARVNAVRLEAGQTHQMRAEISVV